MILVSGCLLGLDCKYNGKNNLKKDLLQFGDKIIPVCPEQLGGLSTPRPPCEIVGGDGHDVLKGSAKVVNEHGMDVTANFTAGAQMTAQIAKITGAKTAILKSNSPSCGSGSIYNGTFTGTKRKGDGVTAALLKKNNIKIYNEADDFEQIFHSQLRR